MILFLVATILNAQLNTQPVHAQTPAAANLLLPVAPVVAWDQEIDISPLPGHHFNLKSPNRCGKGRLLSATAAVVTCRMSSVGPQELEVFVCDDQNTFCKRELVFTEVQWPHTFSGFWQFLKSFF